MNYYQPHERILPPDGLGGSSTGAAPSPLYLSDLGQQQHAMMGYDPDLLASVHHSYRSGSAIGAYRYQPSTGDLAGQENLSLDSQLRSSGLGGLGPRYRGSDHDSSSSSALHCSPLYPQNLYSSYLQPSDLSQSDVKDYGYKSALGAYVSAQQSHPPFQQSPILDDSRYMTGGYGSGLSAANSAGRYSASHSHHQSLGSGSNSQLIGRGSSMSGHMNGNGGLGNDLSSSPPLSNSNSNSSASSSSSSSTTSSKYFGSGQQKQSNHHGSSTKSGMMETGGMGLVSHRPFSSEDSGNDMIKQMMMSNGSQILSHQSVNGIKPENEDFAAAQMQKCQGGKTTPALQKQRPKGAQAMREYGIAGENNNIDPFHDGISPEAAGDMSVKGGREEGFDGDSRSPQPMAIALNSGQLQSEDASGGGDKSKNSVGGLSDSEDGGCGVDGGGGDDDGEEEEAVEEGANVQPMFPWMKSHQGRSSIEYANMSVF